MTKPRRIDLAITNELGRSLYALIDEPMQHNADTAYPAVRGWRLPPWASPDEEIGAVQVMSPPGWSAFRCYWVARGALWLQYQQPGGVVAVSRNVDAEVERVTGLMVRDAAEVGNNEQSRAELDHAEVMEGDARRRL